MGLPFGWAEFKRKVTWLALFKKKNTFSADACSFSTAYKNDRVESWLTFIYQRQPKASSAPWIVSNFTPSITKGKKRKKKNNWTIHHQISEIFYKFEFSRKICKQNLGMPFKDSILFTF